VSPAEPASSRSLDQQAQRHASLPFLTKRPLHPPITAAKGATLSIDTIRTVAVLGSGTMGNGIAHVFARAGYKVILRDVEQRFLDRAVDTISKNLDREIKKGKLPEGEKGSVLARIVPVTDMSAISNADFLVEAVPEKLDIKRHALTEADRLLRDDVIIASNTSSIATTTLAAMTKRPDRFVGMHFMNPVPMMALVEVIRALQTSDASFNLTMEFAKKLGKTPVAVNDAPGFVSNRVLMPLINEAAYTVMEGVATPEAVDTVMKLGMNHPMGPLELADFIGLDVCVDIMHVLHEGLGDPKYRACPLLKKYVAAGYLGRKSGRGFHSYPR
jgi:3-hydroxybutyryl-CoA dehydrogenase